MRQVISITGLMQQGCVSALLTPRLAPALFPAPRRLSKMPHI